MSRQSREYKVALEVELWKTLQTEQHEESMRVKEAKLIKKFSLEYKEKERSSALRLSKSRKSCDDIVRQSKLKLQNMEKREKGLLDSVEKFKRAASEQENDNISKLEDIRQKTSHQQDMLALQLELNEAKIREKKRSNSVLCTRRDNTERNITRKEEDATLSAGNVHSLSEETHLALVTAKLLDTRLRKQVSKLSAEKEKYKHKLRTVLEQLSNEKKRGVKQSIPAVIITPRMEKVEETGEAVTDEILSLKEEIEEMLRTVETVPQPSRVSCTDIETEIAQLISERNTLLNTGVYTDSDYMIVQLDDKIKQLMGPAKC